MAVYVDQGKIPYRGMLMSHMLSDSLAELHAMANQIGLRREWFQADGTPHYDLCQAKRRLAIQLGAIEITRPPDRPPDSPTPRGAARCRDMIPPEPANEFRITDIDGVVLARIELPLAAVLSRRLDQLLAAGLLNAATGIYSLEIVKDGQLVDELYWMEPRQARAVLEAFGADRSALALIVDSVPAANDPCY